jgi:hypothetical protein
MNGLSLIIELIAGAIGGGVAGNALKGNSLGGVGNAIVGAISGGLGGQLLGLVIPGLGGAAAAAGGGSPDMGSVFGQLLGGGVIGAIVTVIVGVIRQRMSGR